MRILIFHGYLLRGTGSNVYNASLAPALAALGHDVHLLCQDRRAGELDWVDSYGEWEGGELRLVDGAGSNAAGSVTAYVPDIGGLLPVYVADEYPGFEVRTFSDLTEEELESYLAANVAAVREVADRAGGVDAALANHLVMGPAILARAGLEFAAKVHGSALEYTVKPEPQRFLPYAKEGIAASSAVLVGSRHTGESLWAAMEGEEVEGKTRLGPPGVDTELFRPIDRETGAERLRAFADSLNESAAPEAGAWGRDPGLAKAAVGRWAEAEGDRVLFVGKLIVSKGVDLLLAAWPLVHAAKPGSRLLVVGFGEYREGLQRLWEAVGRADTDGIAEIAAAGRELEGGDRAPLRMVQSFLADLPGDYAAMAHDAADTVDFAGRLEHDEVARILPAADSLVFPSTFPEAFGMVAAEAAACGVLPVSAAHSGALEVSRTLGAELEPAFAELISFPLGESAVVELASRLARWTELEETERAPVRAALAGLAARIYGWEGVARGVIAASAGRLNELARVPE